MTSPSSTSVATIALLATLASFALGFQLGSRTTNQNALPPSPTPNPTSKTTEVEVLDDSEDEDSDDIADGDLSAIQAGVLQPCKMVLVVRTDLNMTPGKIAAQCGHATLACYKALTKHNPKLVRHWERTGQAKIALQTKTEDRLLELEAIAKSLNLCARSIQDAGRTQVDPGTRTVLAIGPAPVEMINQVTGKLRLL
ncbi:hypothetical protein ONZ45_g10108 [Pleurotus djamor]|nr:hypothetical protein ONZ45_g10108 [Pleurotus djamor]